MKTLKKIAIAALVATTLIPAIVMAQDSPNQGYLVQSDGGTVSSGSNLCWHDSDWTPARAIQECDPNKKPVAAVATPVAAAPVAATLPQKISFSGDAMFSFDKAVLKPEGKTMLDGLAHQLDGTTYDTILATGHTDRLGGNAYNQKLSERRAQVVKDYLVSKDVPANRISAEGKGETQPVTKAGECLGTKSAKIIACLQSDRRVDVEVKATKIATRSK